MLQLKQLNRKRKRKRDVELHQLWIKSQKYKMLDTNQKVNSKNDYQTFF